MRKIIHLDMDCFYAAVEMRERPELEGQPIAVGGGSQRGVVTTCNYEARKYGIRSAMPGFMARERCPQLVFLPVRFELYRAESVKIRSILRAVTPLVEPLSLDEAYLDVSGHEKYAWDIAKEIRKQILDETRLTSSAGIAPNKMLAKIASDWRKPNGQFAIRPEEVESFMKTLPIRKIWGVGPKSTAKFEHQDIHTCGDMQRLSLAELIHQSGKWGHELYHLCRGEDERLVEPNQVRKSLSNESTFSNHLITVQECQSAMDELILELENELLKSEQHRPIHKAFVKVKFADFTRTTRECICDAPNRGIYQKLLLEARQRKNQPVRLLGCGVRFLDHKMVEDENLNLAFEEESAS
jgi:DNA polymerase-4